MHLCCQHTKRKKLLKNLKPNLKPYKLVYHIFLVLTDPSHQRAGGNLRYFERLMFKQLNELNQAYQPSSEEPIQLGTYSRPKDHLPEREAYEALCRGEGVQMVRH